MTSEPAPSKLEEWPSIAVVIPCWNADKWVAGAIASVLDQDYPNLEVVVIDDGSSDGSLETIKGYADKIRWETQPNRGGCAARNRGLSLTTAEYVVFLDADDRLNGGFLCGCRRILAARLHDMVVAPLIVAAREKLYLYDHFFDAKALQDWLLRFLEVSTPQTGQVIWRSDFIRRINGWNETVTKGQDVELALRAILHAPRITYLRDVFGFYNWHYDSRRMTLRDDIGGVSSQITFLKELRSRLVELGGPKAAHALARRFYSLAVAAYERGDPATGGLAERQARALGLNGHVGSVAHRALATAFGLGFKQTLSRQFRDLRRRRAQS